jgi:hypothetical protein
VDDKTVEVIGMEKNGIKEERGQGIKIRKKLFPVEFRRTFSASMFIILVGKLYGNSRFEDHD